MPRPSQLLASAPTADGALTLHQHANGSFTILVAGRMLMNSAARRSEEALATLGCAHVEGKVAPKVLIGGLGMGLTLRAALSVLGPAAAVTVAELNPVVLDWNRAWLGPLNQHAVADPRVTVRIGDVAAVIAEAAEAPASAKFDTILLDLYEGPRAATQSPNDPFYGAAALGRARLALRPHGVLAIWSEEPDNSFEARLGRAGFAARTEILKGGGGGRHVVYLGVRAR